LTDDDESGTQIAATANNIEPLDSKEENEVSLDGFGSANITCTTADEEQEEDDNKYYRDQLIEEANRKYGANVRQVRENGNGKRKRTTSDNGKGNSNTKAESEEVKKIISKSQVYKLGNHFLAEAILIGEHNQPYWITSESLNNQISTQEFIDITDDIDGKQKKHLYPPRKSLYLNEPYTFDSIEQVKQLIEHVKTTETPDTLFAKIRTQWKKYVSESDNHINS
jgi:hypothetical protein